MKKGKTFKVCSTCINFKIRKTAARNTFHCSRLGYETKPHYSFSCWDPNKKVKRMMEEWEEAEKS